LGCVNNYKKHIKKKDVIMPVYVLLIWIVIGVLIGWFAKRVFGKAGPFGLVGDIIAGVVGAIIGGYLLAGN
jgi:uncharacterized membrane protein YeaQ/YmgE (transglycosylase-associated protein family)